MSDEDGVDLFDEFDEVPGVGGDRWDDPTENRMHALEARLAEAEAAVREVRMARDLAEREVENLSRELASLGRLAEAILEVLPSKMPWGWRKDAVQKLARKQREIVAEVAT